MTTFDVYMTYKFNFIGICFFLYVLFIGHPNLDIELIVDTSRPLLFFENIDDFDDEELNLILLEENLDQDTEN